MRSGDSTRRRFPVGRSLFFASNVGKGGSRSEWRVNDAPGVRGQATVRAVVMNIRLKFLRDEWYCISLN